MFGESTIPSGSGSQELEACIQVKFHPTSPGPGEYYAGSIRLVGNVPLDGSWNDMYFNISGHLALLNDEVVMFVDSVLGCGFVPPATQV